MLTQDAAIQAAKSALTPLQRRNVMGTEPVSASADVDVGLWIIRFKGNETLRP